VLDESSLGAGLLVFPGFFGHIQQTTGLSSEKELKRGEAGGSLRNLPYTEEDVREHLIPVPPVLGCHPP
jgi:hypothetical protein